MRVVTVDEQTVLVWRKKSGDFRINLIGWLLGRGVIEKEAMDIKKLKIYFNIILTVKQKYYLLIMFFSAWYDKFFEKILHAASLKPWK